MDIKTLGGILAEMEEVLISPKRGVIVGINWSQTCRVQCAIPTEDIQDMGVHPGTLYVISKRVRDRPVSIQWTPTWHTIRLGNTTYKIRPFTPAQYTDPPQTQYNGTITIQPHIIHEALLDVQTSGSDKVAISIMRRNNQAKFQSTELHDVSVVCDAECTGMGYCILDIQLMISYIKHIKSDDITISLHPTQPIQIRADDYTIHQAAAKR